MKTVLYILTFIILSFLVYLGFYNAFYSPKFEVSTEGGETVVYQQVYGHYHLTDSVMKNVFNELYKKNGIVVTKGFGTYFDNPFEIKENDMHFRAGCIVEDADTAKLSVISKEFIIEQCEDTQYIVSDFPLKGKMSIMFGMFKVYPKMEKYCEKHGFDTTEPVMEIYDRVEKKIHYRRKVVKQ